MSSGKTFTLLLTYIMLVILKTVDVQVKWLNNQIEL